MAGILVNGRVVPSCSVWYMAFPELGVTIIFIHISSFIKTEERKSGIIPA